jgi:hypothetical protein
MCLLSRPKANNKASMSKRRKQKTHRHKDKQGNFQLDNDKNSIITITPKIMR